MKNINSNNIQNSNPKFISNKKHRPKSNILGYKLVLNFFVIIIGFSLSACHQVNGIGPIVNETRDLNDFNTIVSTLPTPVYITQGKHYEVTLEGQQNILDIVETKLEDNRLILKIKKGYSVSGRLFLIIRIKSPNIKGIENIGSGNLSVLNHFESTNLSLKNTGSGNIDMEGFWTKKLSVSSIGSGSITIRDGSAEKASVMLTGSGYLMAPNLACKNSYIQITGSGNVTTGKCDTLNARLTGSGNLTYQSAAQLTKNISGSGHLIELP